MPKRQREVADLIAEGYSVVNTAALLDVSSRTVRSHLKSAYRKLGTGGRTQLVRLALGLS